MKVFIVEDSSFVSLDIKKKLMSAGYKVSGIAASGETALKMIAKDVPDLVIMDVMLTGNMDGIETASELKKKYNMPILYLTSHTDDKTVKRASETNPVGYLIKPIRSSQLKVTVDMTFDKIIAEREASEARARVKKVSSELQKTYEKMDDLKKKYSLISDELKKNIELNLVGRTDAIKKVLDQAMIAARNPNANVLITGESGTGKEIITRIIHYASSRKDNFLCAVNSSAIPDTLLESEFFGHVKGAFTGALEDNVGHFEMANNGTLYLDEIGDMPYRLQAKMLRVIETKTIRKIGSQKEIKLNFRLISSTNKDIYKYIDENKFRLDLLHRLNTIHIHIPPLRERKDDIQTLLEYFVKKFSEEFKREIPQISSGVFTKLTNYRFPGNVRELRNLVENALIHNTSNKLNIEDFGINQMPERYASTENETIINFNVRYHEEILIKKALDATDGNQTYAAQELGFSRDTLRRKMKMYNIQSY